MYRDRGRAVTSARVPVCTTLPAFEDDDAVGQGVGVDGVVGDEEPDAVEGGQVATQVPAHVAASAGIERGERFIEQEQARLGGQGAGQRHALSLAAGQGAGAVLGVVGQPDPLQPRRGLGTCLATGGAPGPQTEGDVLERGEVVEQQVVLEHDGHRPPLGRHEDIGLRLVQGGIVEHDAPGVDGEQAGEAAEQGALARTVRAEDGHNLAGLGFQLDL